MFNAFLMSEMQSIIKYTSGLLQRIQIDNDIEGTLVLNEKLQKRYNMIKNSIMSSSFDKRIRMIKDNPSISSIEMANLIGINRSAISKHLKKLKEDHIIKREGPAKGGKWIIITS